MIYCMGVPDVLISMSRVAGMLICGSRRYCISMRVLMDVGMFMRRTLIVCMAMRMCVVMCRTFC